jgi:hypothetical protein
MRAIGATLWAIAEGYIPSKSTGLRQGTHESRDGVYPERGRHQRPRGDLGLFH